jgi:hypothetical protein
MKSILEMSPDEARAEAERRRELQRRGLPFDALVEQLRTPTELEADDERLEKAIEHAGDKQMAALGFEIVKFSHPGRTKQTPGIPDRRYYHRARKLVLWWEAKSATGRQRPDQRWFQEMCEACGEIYVLGNDRDLYTWLVEHRVAAWTVGDLLISLPFTDYLP